MIHLNACTLWDLLLEMVYGEGGTASNICLKKIGVSAFMKFSPTLNDDCFFRNVPSSPVCIVESSVYCCAFTMTV